MELKELFFKYQQQRLSCLDIDQFASMMLMYPALLVATADGNYEELEKRNLVSAVQEAAGDDPFIAFEMYAELSHLVNANYETKEMIFSCIKTEIAERKDLQEIIIELMLSSAKSADNISNTEQQIINEIRDLLNI